MTSLLPLRLSPGRSRRAIVWALVALLPLQTILAALLAARGPLHAHRPVRALVVLEDVRRAVHGAGSAATLPAHRHGFAAQRHHHASGDASVVAIDDPWAAADAASAGSAGQPALCASLFGWRAEAFADVRRAAPSWAPRTHDPPPLERPPRLA